MEDKLKSYLEAWDTVGARNLFAGDLIKEEMDLISWDLISLISSYMTQETEDKCPILVATCSDLLEIVSGYGSAKELLVGLLENCESFAEPVRCLNSLPALSKVLLRLPEAAKVSSWSWSLSTLISYLQAYSALPSKGLDSENRALLENDPDVLVRVKAIEAFTDTLVDPLMNDLPQNPDIRIELSTFILNMLHKPILELNLHKEENKDYESRSYIVSKRLLDHLLTLLPNPFRLHLLYEKLLHRESGSSFENRRFTPQSIGCVFYLIYGEGLRLEALPAVFTPLFVLNTLLPTITNLCSELNENAVFKGLFLFKKLAESMDPLCIEEVDSDMNREFLQALMKVIVYHDLREYRVLAYANYNAYYGLFSHSAKVIFFKCVIHLSNHSGLIGDAVTKWKDMVLWNLSEGLPYPQYQGEALRQIIQRVCQLSHGAETDLLEVSDEIQSLLNALFALFTRDSGNTTGIWDLAEELDSGFMCALREGLTLSREHYKLKLRNEENSNSASSKPEVTLMVSGQSLPEMSQEELKALVNSAICTFDMMELSLCRLGEALKRNK